MFPPCLNIDLSPPNYSYSTSRLLHIRIKLKRSCLPSCKTLKLSLTGYFVLWFLPTEEREKKAITATSPGTSLTRSLQAQPGIRAPDPFSFITYRDEATWTGSQGSLCGLIGSLDEIMWMIQTREDQRGKSKKRKKKDSSWFPSFFDFLDSCYRLPFRCLGREHYGR